MGRGIRGANRIVPTVLAAALCAGLSAAALLGRDAQTDPPPGPASEDDVAAAVLADELEAYLWRHVLAPRFPAAVDAERGGFHARFARDWTRLPDRHRFVVYQARMTWTAAAVVLARPDRREEYLPFVRHGTAFLRDAQWDREHGGFHTTVRLDGTPDPGVWSVKIAYGQAFALYALAAAHRATGDPEPLELARRSLAWIEKHLREGDTGYRGGVMSDGRPLPFDPTDVQPPMDAMGTPSGYRDMNAHIHLLEAYTELLRAWPDPELRRRTRALFELLRDRFFARPGCLHAFLDPEGRPVPGPVSFGHDVETAYLFLDAAEVLGLGARERERTREVAGRLVDHALAWGWNTRTGQFCDHGSGLFPPRECSVEWWVQFEAVNALSLMDSLHGRRTPRYREAMRTTWRFTRETLTDHEHGGYFARLDARGGLDREKSHDWMASYHAARALLLTVGRLRSGAEGAAAGEAGRQSGQEATAPRAPGVRQ